MPRPAHPATGATEEPLFEHVHAVSFGDCDPAGILFYPNHFRMMDATFQAWLRAGGLDQRTIQERFGAIGTGLIDAQATFRAPVVDGDALRHTLSPVEWGDRTLSLVYEGFVGDRRVVEGRETRGLFRRDPARAGRLTLTDLAPLRALLGA